MIDANQLPAEWASRVSLLLEDIEQTPLLVTQLRKEQPRLRGREKFISRTVIRLALAYRDYARSASRPERRGAADVVVLLRQVIRLIGGEILLSDTLWQRLRQHAEKAKLIAAEGDDHQLRVMALPWSTDWLDSSERMDELGLRSDGEGCAADGMLYAMSSDTGTPWTTYRTAAQKAAVDCWTYAPAGSTTLVTLPTGSGKSICTLLPAWFDSQGGRRSRESTLVIVPTVALAIDQEDQAARYFSNARGEHARPTARTGDTSALERLEIEAALRDGRLPIIFTSPESLLGSHLYDVILDATRRGQITRFVIDEAHLVESWGMGFRPEFQLLASYRRQLLEASGGQLRTLLLSATITQRSRETLEKLFADPEPLIVVQANRLRPEPGYWFHLTPSEELRQQRVLEALRFLPRPLILYVTQPLQAEAWMRTLRKEGYARLEQFTGKTSGDARQRILQQWANNEIDVVVATSAFGLGVDKDDVRSVVHATIPENIDRFYQEVGRSGRDGYSSVSLLCATDSGFQRDDDISMAFGLTPKFITLDKALPRWKAMLASSQSDAGLYWVDRDTRPIGRDDMAEGERNRDWNDHLLLLMQRAGLIEIADVPPPVRDENGGVTNRLPIRILRPAIFNAPVQTLGEIESQRDKEKDQALEAVNQIVELVRSQSKKKPTTCLSQTFAMLYADAQLACGGCPECRAKEEAAYASPLTFTIEYPSYFRRTGGTVDILDPIDPTLDLLLGASRTLNLTWRGNRTMTGLAPVMEMLPTLVKGGFVQVIYPDELFDDPALRERVMAELGTPDPQQPARRHRLLPVAWIIEQEYPLFALPTVVIYPPEDAAANLFYRVMKDRDKQKGQADGTRMPARIHIVHENLYVASANNTFIELVDGWTNHWEWLRARLTRAQREESFF